MKLTFLPQSILKSFPMDSENLHLNSVKISIKNSSDYVKILKSRVNKNQNTKCAQNKNTEKKRGHTELEMQMASEFVS